MQRPMKIELVERDGVNRLSIKIGHHEAMLDGTDVETFIELLSFYRAAMKPKVAENLSPTHRYLIEVNPCWHVEGHPTQEGIVLLLRHSGYGWTGFFIPSNRLDTLHANFCRYLATPAHETNLLSN